MNFQSLNHDKLFNLVKKMMANYCFFQKANLVCSKLFLPNKSKMSLGFLDSKTMSIFLDWQEINLYVSIRAQSSTQPILLLFLYIADSECKHVTVLLLHALSNGFQFFFNSSRNRNQTIFYKASTIYIWENICKLLSTRIKEDLT